MFKLYLSSAAPKFEMFLCKGYRLLLLFIETLYECSVEFVNSLDSRLAAATVAC